MQNIPRAKVLLFVVLAVNALITWQFYKSFSSGLKDIMWNTEENTEENLDRKI
jgi:hypothetical protein